MRWSLVARVAAAAAVLVAAALAALIWWQGRAASQAYAAGEWGLAESRYAQAGRLMAFERWKAPFGEGTAILAGGDAEGAEEPLELALARAPEGRQCLVRTNLSLAQETQGDSAAEAGDRAGAVERWQTALATLRDGDCPAQSEVAAEAEARLELKLQDPDQEQPEPEGEGQPDSEDEPQPTSDPSQSGSPSSGSGPPSQQPSQSPSQPSGGGEPSLDPEAQRKLDRLEELNDEGRRLRGDMREYQDFRETEQDWTRPIW
ncbi:MAG: hypothetical protein LBD90_01040 [Bifidobacteriaceae bacterium]|jgi:tetratricopeptide (TPR) repeat protein|nr:hypothetical protein [Bifidobacteriaceae bacterium]